MNTLPSYHFNCYDGGSKKQTTTITHFTNILETTVKNIYM